MYIARRGDGSIPHPELAASEICIEGAAARPTALNSDANLVEVVRIEEIEGIAAQLEGNSLGHVKNLRKAYIEVAITWLAEILHSWAIAGVEIETIDRFESIDIQQWLAHVDIP